MISREEPKPFNTWMTKEKMMTYHKLLDIAPYKEEEERLPTLERNVAHSQKKTAKKRKTMARD